VQRRGGWICFHFSLSVVAAAGVGDGGGFGGASEGAEGFEALVSYRKVESGHFWVGEAV
jgi:hypothetical protein